MAEIRDAYERIMGLGQEEMVLLADQNMDQLGHVVMAREEAINAFISSDMGEQDKTFLEKLLCIQKMNTQLRQEARVLHQSLKEELIKVRSENKRIGGYRNGALITPLNRHVLSRKG